MRMILMTLGLLAATFSMPAHAEEPVPERRVVQSNNVDFYGSDLANIFDTTLQACENACLADMQCRAFTFNQRSGACFPKGDVTQVVPYDGAISARILTINPAVMDVADMRAAELGFLEASDLEQAFRLARSIGRVHPPDETSVPVLLTAADFQRGAGNSLAALGFIGAAVAVADTADLWLDYARLALSATTPDDAAVDATRNNAVPAAVNGYLRALNAGTQATALADLAAGLEWQGRGALAIPALRLAQEIQPREDTAVALDRVIGLFGFNLVDTVVESDSASPRICAVFSGQLVRAGVDYATYVQLPDPGLTVEVADNQLCIDGVTHGTRYRIVLRQGLPAASGETLVRPVEIAQYVRDRSPGARFVSRAYVLPRLGEIALPIETVNIETVELRLSRVSDRNLLRTMQEDLFARPLHAWREAYFAEQIGEEIWTGTADVTSTLNRDTLTRLPLTDALGGQPAGVYVLTAAVPGADPYDTPPASQWFILSDLGVATMLGTDGLTVIVRALGDATAREGAEVILLSRANAVLGSAVTDAAGVAHFAPGLTRGTGASAPALVSVTQDEDMAFLSLTDPAFDLSDRGVEGREPAQPIDVFLATDRGAYRAGEAIKLTALMRDATALALPGVPLTAILTRPDGVEYSRVTSTTDSGGGHVFALPVAASAPRGAWRIDLRADMDAPPLATTAVLIEDFLPERIDFDLSLPDVVRLGDTPNLAINARYLFGPPAGDLPVEGEALLRAAESLAGFDGYSFGRHDMSFDTRLRSFGGDRTGPDGAVSVDVALPEVEGDLARPLEMVVTARLSEASGRPVERRVTVQVRPDGPIIGVRSLFDGVAAEGSEVRFALIGLTPDLAPQSMKVEWTLNRVNTRYQWYQLHGNWNWEPVTTRRRVATGTTSLTNAPVEIATQVDWGRYELVVERTDGAYAAASVGFDAGWYAPAGAVVTPDMLDASLDAADYAIGGTATLRIVPRHAGTAIVTVMADRVIAMQTVNVSEGENLIQLPVTEEWGAGAYVSAMVIRPMDVAANRNPTRALGLVHAVVAPGEKALSVTLDVPETALPRGPMSVGVQVDGLPQADDQRNVAGGTGFVTLAAVDLGILNLTGFVAPDPSAHYFGQRKLGMELRDIYGNLIDGMTGTLGNVRSGGDAMAGMRMQAPPPTEQLLAWFAGPMPLDAQGHAELSIDLPVFNGTVRLMAIAWSPLGVGQATADVLVRDPIVLTASLPRFLAPGDRSRLLIELVHADGSFGEAEVSVTADGIDLARDASLTARLEEGGAGPVPFRSLRAMWGTTALLSRLSRPAARSWSAHLPFRSLPMIPKWRGPRG